MSDTDELLSIRAAELYYEENQTQDEIGVILRLTRWKVGRLLASAKANGFIRIEIVHPRARRNVLRRESALSVDGRTAKRQRGTDAHFAISAAPFTFSQMTLSPSQAAAKSLPSRLTERELCRALHI